MGNGYCGSVNEYRLLNKVHEWHVATMWLNNSTLNFNVMKNE